MKKTGILWILFLMIFHLSACGLEYDNSLSEPIDAATQESVSELPSSVNVKSPIEQIKNGDFSNVTDLSDNLNEYLKQIYGNGEGIEWLECELNENGLKGLLMQQQDSSPLEIKRIEAIFAVKEDEVRLVCSQYGKQGTECYVLCKNGNIIYAYSVYGTSSSNYYAHYTFRDDWSKELVNSLTVIRTEDWAIKELKEDGLYEDFVKEYPYWANPGIYYYTKDSDAALDEPQFLKAFEEMTGYSFYEDNPMKPDWASTPNNE